MAAGCRMKIGQYESHPLADVFPLIEGDDYKKLCDDIAENGLRESIVRVWADDEGVTRKPLIIDGRNRLRACLKVGVQPTFTDYTGTDLMAFVISANLRRRHMEVGQLAIAAKKLATLEKGSNQHAPIGAPSQSDAATMMKVSRRNLQRAGTVLDKGVPELVDAVERGEIKVSAAAEIAKLEAEQQRELVADKPKAKAVVRELRAVKKPAPVEPVSDDDEDDDDEDVPSGVVMIDLRRGIRDQMHRWKWDGPRFIAGLRSAIAEAEDHFATRKEVVNE